MVGHLPVIFNCALLCPLLLPQAELLLDLSFLIIQRALYHEDIFFRYFLLIPFLFFCILFTCLRLTHGRFLLLIQIQIRTCLERIFGPYSGYPNDTLALGFSCFLLFCWFFLSSWFCCEF